MASKRIWWILGGTAAAVATIGLAAAFMGDEANRERALGEIFEVGPDCTYIHLRGGAEGMSEEETKDILAQADTYYIDPMIKAQIAAGNTDSKTITIFILEDLFPACKGEFPPGELLDVSKQLVWFGMWSHVTERMEQMGVSS